MITYVGRFILSTIWLSSLVWADEDNSTQCALDRPNLLHIVLDQLRYDCIGFIQERMSEYDGALKIKTPNMDRLFRRSAVFENAYCVSPVCTPARATIKTGLVVQRSGQHTNAVMHEKNYNKVKTLQNKISKAITFEKILKDNGYNVENYGKWHLPLAWYDHDNKTVIDLDYYDFERDEYGRMPSQLFLDKYRAFAPYLMETGNQSVTTDKKYTMRNLLTGYPYEKLVGRFGRDKLGRNYTYTAVLGQMASKSLGRLLESNSSFSISVHFLAPHKPWVVNDYHLNMYLPHKNQILFPSSYDDTLVNSAYNNKKSSKYWKFSKSKLRILQAIYYALITEVDDWIGVLLDQIEEAGMTNCTLISLTSDHGELMGAHHHIGKGKFYRESVKVPWSFSLPGVIPVGVIPEDVSHLDSVATFLDYLNVSQFDVSDGTSLRRYLDYQGINDQREECAVISEMDERRPLDRREFTRMNLGREPEFMIVHRGFKLMLPKVATSPIRDMLFNLKRDPYEMKNLLGSRGNRASIYTVSRAEYLKVLLIEYLELHDGEDRVYSDPKYFYEMTRGDLAEVIDRSTWRKVPLWVSHWETMKFGRPSYSENQNKYIRNEFLYLGRTLRGKVEIESISIDGKDAALFTVDGNSFALRKDDYRRLKVTYENDDDVDWGQIEAQLHVNVTGTGILSLDLRVSNEICPS